jgi:hypothetical protein
VKGSISSLIIQPEAIDLLQTLVDDGERSLYHCSSQSQYPISGIADSGDVLEHKTFGFTFKNILLLSNPLF